MRATRIRGLPNVRPEHLARVREYALALEGWSVKVVPLPDEEMYVFELRGQGGIAPIHKSWTRFESQTIPAR